MKNTLLFIVLISFQAALAQQDYLVLKNGDTLTGSVRCMNEKYLKYKIGQERNKIPTGDVKEYKRGEHLYLLIDYSENDQITSCRVEVDGQVRLLRDIQKDINGSTTEDFVIIEQVLYPITEAYLSDAIWEVLSQCTAFKQKYEEYKAKKFFMNMPKLRKRWKAMISYYNKQCN